MKTYDVIVDHIVVKKQPVYSSKSPLRMYRLHTQCKMDLAVQCKKNTFIVYYYAETCTRFSTSLFLASFYTDLAVKRHLDYCSYF